MKREPESHMLLRKHLDELGMEYRTEVLFHPIRKWRWDFTVSTRDVDYGDAKCINWIAIEIQGSVWAGRKGGHTGGIGMQRDMDKRNAGVALGWKVLTFSTQDVLRGRAKAFLAENIT